MDIKRQGRNYTVDFYRFFFACVIYIGHIRNYKSWETPHSVFNGSYLSVEFFFILSGFFIAEKCQKEQEKGQHNVIPEYQTVKYFISRYKRLMPQYLVSILTLLFANVIIYENFNLKTSILKSFPEIIACSIFWKPDGTVNLHLWYVSGLIWAGTLVYFLILKNKNFSICILFPFSLLLFVGYAYAFVGHIDVTPASNLYMIAFLRAFVEIGFGCILYHIYTYVRDRTFNPVVMTIGEIVFFSAIVIIMWRTRRDYKDFIMVFFWGAFVLVTMLGQGYVSKLLNNKIFATLGELSYPMYLNQRLFQNIARQVFPGLPFWPVVIVSILALMIYSQLITYFLTWAKTNLHLKNQIYANK